MAEAVKAELQEHKSRLSKEKETLSWFYLFTKRPSRFRHIIYQKETETCNSHVALNTQQLFYLVPFAHPRSLVQTQKLIRNKECYIQSLCYYYFNS